MAFIEARLEIDLFRSSVRRAGGIFQILQFPESFRLQEPILPGQSHTILPSLESAGKQIETVNFPS